MDSERRAALETAGDVKPCPFCGAAPRYILEGPHHEQETHIFCVCEVEPIVIVEGANKLADAAAIWNRRAVDPERRAALETAIEACDEGLFYAEDLPKQNRLNDALAVLRQMLEEGEGGPDCATGVEGRTLDSGSDGTASPIQKAPPLSVDPEHAIADPCINWGHCAEIAAKLAAREKTMREVAGSMKLMAVELSAYSVDWHHIAAELQRQAAKLLEGLEP